MVLVEVLDPRARAYKARAVRLLTWLMKESSMDDRTIECSLVGNDQMAKNVLSYPANASFPRPDIASMPLGDLYVNPIYIKDHGEDFEYMIVHGFLHLLGYDHMKKNDRMKMEKKEKNLLAKFRRSTIDSKH